jgi:6-phosphogluconolactonase
VSLAAFIVKAQKEALEKKGKFTIALSGGSLPNTLRGLIDNAQVKWNFWYCQSTSTPVYKHSTNPYVVRHVFYVDERAVPLDHPDSNHNACVNALFSKVPIPSENIHAIDQTLLEDLDELSDAYEKDLIREFAMKDSARFPIFDLVLLGMGPDGHTASLFPDHPLLLEDDRWVAPIDDSPKPPARRITLTFPVINHAARIGFVAAGKEKNAILKAVLDSPHDEGSKLPATRVKPVYPGKLFWFVDDQACEGVEYPKTSFKH